MSKNSAVHQQKVNAAVWILQNTKLVSAFCRLILAGFLKLDAVIKNRAPGSKASPPTKAKQQACRLTCPNQWRIIVVSDNPQNKLYHT